MKTETTFSARYGPWALVTGAAMGLGAEFARQLGEHGLNLALADVDAGALAASTGVQVRQFVGDLSTPAGIAALVEAAGEMEIGLLVSNAGVSTIGHFLELPLEKHLKILELNARAPCCWRTPLVWLCANAAAAESSSSPPVRPSSATAMSAPTRRPRPST